jgi:hypothetical protein
MFALVAAIIFFLRAFGVIDNTADVDWFTCALGFLALHFFWNPWPIVVARYNNRRVPPT